MKTIRVILALRLEGVPPGPISGGDEVPVPRTHALLDLSLDQPALEGTEVLDEQPAMQMIDLVVEGAGHQLATLQHPRPTPEIHRLDQGSLRAGHPLGESRKAQTALVFQVAAGALD